MKPNLGCCSNIAIIISYISVLFHLNNPQIKLESIISDNSAWDLSLWSQWAHSAIIKSLRQNDAFVSCRREKWRYRAVCPLTRWWANIPGWAFCPKWCLFCPFCGKLIKSFYFCDVYFRRKYLCTKNLTCVWSWSNFKELHQLVNKIWACILSGRFVPLL